MRVSQIEAPERNLSLQHHMRRTIMTYLRTPTAQERVKPPPAASQPSPPHINTDQLDQLSLHHTLLDSTQPNYTPLL